MATPYPHIGSLNQKIIIQISFSNTKQDTGEKITGWTFFAYAWAKVTDSGGNEELEAGQIVAADTVTFTIRYIQGIKPKMRILHNGMFYNIRSVSEIGRHRFLTLKTETRDYAN